MLLKQRMEIEFFLVGAFVRIAQKDVHLLAVGRVLNRPRNRGKKRVADVG